MQTHQHIKNTQVTLLYSLDEGISDNIPNKSISIDILSTKMLEFLESV